MAQGHTPCYNAASFQCSANLGDAKHFFRKRERYMAAFFGLGHFRGGN
jgi:hypothetical protein